jgi:protein-tyrosine phosphatase
VIDLHCHLLPDIDDGPADLEASLQMAHAALEDGIHTIVATPHVNLRYGTELEAIGAGVEELRSVLARNRLPISVLGGAEIALSRLPGLDDGQIGMLCLGDSSCALIESPYTAAGSLIEESVFDLVVRGFRPLLAHPERCPEFQRDLPRLERLVDSGVSCSISANSIVGQFGETVRRFALRLVELGLVHNVSSDAHDSVKRPPSIGVAFRAGKGPLGDTELQRWLTSAVPAALLADEPLPPRPPISSPSRWRRPTARG